MTTEDEVIRHERALIWELKRETCRCGQKKGQMQTFCSRCFYTLPKLMRNALYKRVGEGYREAYLEAEQYLKTKGLVV